MIPLPILIGSVVIALVVAVCEIRKWHYQRQVWKRFLGEQEKKRREADFERKTP